MDDLISRAALLERFAEMQKNDPEKDGRGFACYFLNDAREPSTEWYCVEDAVESIPAVDAVPVVHGKWNDKYWTTDYDWGVFNHRAIVCSACNNEIYKGEKSPYCPNCGAKMDGE